MRLSTNSLQKYEISPVMISRWKKEFIDNSAAAFETPKFNDEKLQKREDAYLQKIRDRDTRRKLIFPNGKLSISAQCEILGVSRTVHYNKPKGECEYNLKVMEEIDKGHIEHPAKGVVGMTDYLLECDYKVGQRCIWV